MDNLTINIINNNNQKVYTSFVVRDKNNQPQQITTDSQSEWNPLYYKLPNVSVA